MANRNNEYTKRRFPKLRNEFGGSCFNCRSQERLEFAHRAPTKLRGKGRGKSRRLLDILRNRTSYVLLCRNCHKRFDNGKLYLKEKP